MIVIRKKYEISLPNISIIIFSIQIQASDDINKIDSTLNYYNNILIKEENHGIEIKKIALEICLKMNMVLSINF